jgi:hypothetical protein
VAAGIGGYRRGLDEIEAQRVPGAVFTKAYAVRDLVIGPGMTEPDFDSLISQLVLLSPQKWAHVGGQGCISGYDNAGIIVVQQDDATHRQIKRKLAAFRRHNRWYWLDKNDYFGKAVAFINGDDK